MIYPLTRFTILPLLRSFIKSVDGLDNLPPQAPFIIASNHISQSDALLIIATLFPLYKKKIHYIANYGNYGRWFATHIVTNWAGCILINPVSPDNKCLEVAGQWLKRNDLVGIFPEGERVPDGSFLRRGKTGVARLALSSGLPVVPIGIITNGEKHRESEGRKISKPGDAIQHYLLHGSKSRFIIGSPLEFGTLSNERFSYDLLRSVADKIMTAISRLTSTPLSDLPFRRL